MLGFFRTRHGSSTPFQILRFLARWKLSVSENMSRKTTICVIGSGNGSHVLVGLAASRADVEMRVLTSSEEKMRNWTELLRENDVIVKQHTPDGEMIEVTILFWLISDVVAVYFSCILYCPTNSVRACDVFGSGSYLLCPSVFVTSGCLYERWHQRQCFGIVLWARLSAMHIL